MSGLPERCSTDPTLITGLWVYFTLPFSWIVNILNVPLQLAIFKVIVRSLRHMCGHLTITLPCLPVYSIVAQFRETTFSKLLTVILRSFSRKGRVAPQTYPSFKLTLVCIRHQECYDDRKMIIRSFVHVFLGINFFQILKNSRKLKWIIL